MSKEQLIRSNIFFEISENQVQSQLENYRALNSKAGTILGFTSIFVPIFIFVLEKSYLIVKILSIAPLICMVFGILKILKVMQTRNLQHGYSFNQTYKDLSSTDELNIKTTLISANNMSISKNSSILNEQNKNYNTGLRLIVFSIIVSIFILIFNIFL